MNKTAITIIIGSLAIAGAIIFSNQPDEKMIHVPIENNVDLKEEFEQGFMEGCVGDDVSAISSCSCMYDGALEVYGFDKFVDISIEYAQTEQIPASFEDVVANCV